MVPVTEVHDPAVAGAMAALPALSRRRAGSVLRGLEAFAHANGIGPGHDELFDLDVIEAFCVRGMGPRRPPTKGTYRSVLYHLAADRLPTDRRRTTPFSGARSPAPYSAADRAELGAVAAAQPRPWLRHGAEAMLALGMGAGLAAGELVACRGGDVTIAGGQVVVAVRGRRARSVPVRAAWGERAEALAAQAGDGVVFRPGLAQRSYKNAVNDFARKLVSDPAAARLSSGRCRSSFICDHLAAGTPLGALMEMAGVAEVESLARYAAHLAVARSKADLRQALSTQGGR